MNLARVLMTGIHDDLEARCLEWEQEIRWAKWELARVQAGMQGRIAVNGGCSQETEMSDMIINGAKSTLDELQGLLEWKIQELDSTKTRVDALRAEADALWAAQSTRLAEIEAIQTTIQLLSAGPTLELRTGWHQHVSHTPPALLEIEETDTDLEMESTPGHTTVMDIGTMAQTVVPQSSYSIVKHALKVYGKPIRPDDLCALIHQDHHEIAPGTVAAYLSQLWKDGLVDRPERGVYVWVDTAQEETDDE